MIWCHLYRWHPFSSSRRLGKPCQQARATRSPAFHHFPMARRANFAPSRVYHRLSSYSSFPFSLGDCSIRSVGDYLLKRGAQNISNFEISRRHYFYYFPHALFPRRHSHMTAKCPTYHIYGSATLRPRYMTKDPQRPPSTTTRKKRGK